MQLNGSASGEYNWLIDSSDSESAVETDSQRSCALPDSSSHPSVDGEICYKISNSHLMDEFFISLVSSSNHWMFVSSNGALSCGRRDPNGALFPYYSADKLVDMSASTGPRTIVRFDSGENEPTSWEPFTRTEQGRFRITRNLYKNLPGNKLFLEETNETLQLRFRYCWTFCERFGFVRRCRLTNHGEQQANITILDGLQNILPHGLDDDFQLRFSNLGDAYKKNELVSHSQIGLFYLSSVPTDRAEPSEGLRASIAWQRGFDQPKILLSDNQLQHFRNGEQVETEADVRGRRGAYFVVNELQLEPGARASWDIVADVGLDQTDVINLDRLLRNSSDIQAQLDKDIAIGQRDLVVIISAGDGCQKGAEQLRTHRHQSNVLFNAMRGGIPVSHYRISPRDFASHVKRFNRKVFDRNHELLNSLTANSQPILLHGLRRHLQQNGDMDLLRIGLEYLPLTFSRRHGDPTRPWNAFSIDVRNPDGSSKVSYQGNWRDIFQNWEALAVSYPEFISGMIFRFVNASTADGYNPYRLTSDGFDWETIDPNDPWSNIGYWGDHQIVYLLKLLEWSRNYHPAGLNEWLSKACCTYAQVPYRIRSCEAIRRDPTETIDFDDELATEIERRTRSLGADGKLLPNENGGIHHVSLVEKLLVPALVKLTNFVPDGGIWLNTQRPEWNDANNALVGNGLSVVTVCYLRRYLVFLRDWFADQSVPDSLAVSGEVAALMQEVGDIFGGLNNANAAGDNATGDSVTDPQVRGRIVDQLSRVGSDYRETFYSEGFSGDSRELTKSDCNTFFDVCIEALDQTIKSNRREDGLYHSYNLMCFDDSGVEAGVVVEHLHEMLEGQVAVLSCGLLTAQEAVDLLDSLRASKMYRADQQSYMLYPDRELPGFIEKNAIPAGRVSQSELLKQLVTEGDESVIRQDVAGNFHFNGDFRNAANLRNALHRLATDDRYADAVSAEVDAISHLFEEVFQHRRFTGRSGTFFAYEGLGSIYWHMVSKLALATMENMISATTDNVTPATIDLLHSHYREIRNGIAFGKTLQQYGAFPSDPYSHTPAGSGVKQPGMTGQVKEDVLSRFAELGLRVRDGVIGFDPTFFETCELLSEPSTLDYIDQRGNSVSLEVPKDGFAWTLCQTPIVYRRSEHDNNGLRMAIYHRDADGNEVVSRRSEMNLTQEETRQICSRDGRIRKIEVFLTK